VYEQDISPAGQKQKKEIITDKKIIKK